MSGGDATGSRAGWRGIDSAIQSGSSHYRKR